MVEKPYYQAEMDGSTHIKYTDIRDAINQLGVKRADRTESKYGYGPDRRGHYEIEVNSWAYGPQLILEKFNKHGETEFPQVDKRLTQVIIQQGYVPTSFRPEMDGTKAGPREHTGRWLWYCRPVEDICDESSRIYETAFALQKADDSFVRTDDGDLVTFEERDRAEAVRHDDLEVVEVND